MTYLISDRKLSTPFATFQAKTIGAKDLQHPSINSQGKRLLDIMRDRRTYNNGCFVYSSCDRYQTR